LRSSSRARIEHLKYSCTIKQFGVYSRCAYPKQPRRSTLLSRWSYHRKIRFFINLFEISTCRARKPLPDHYV